MNLDSRVSSAVAETTSAPLDVERRLVELRHTSRRRRTARAGAAVVVAAVVVTGLAINRYQPTTPRPAPAPQPSELHGGAVLALTPAGRVTQVGGPGLDSPPPAAAPEGPFAFSHDATSFVYAAGGQVRRLDLRNGDDAAIGACPDAQCRVAYNEDLTRTATVEGKTVVVANVDGSGTPARLHLGTQVDHLTWSPASFALAFTTHRHGRATLELVDLGTRRVTRLVQLQAGDGLLGSPAWSPSGHQIAFVVHAGREGVSALVGLQAVTTVRQPLVTDVHEIDRCVCQGYAPGIAWSPDGTRLLVTGTGRARNAGGPLWSVLSDGSQWRRQVAGVFSHAVAWQPPVTPQQ